MDAREFKAWFEGFTDSIGETPTKEQFEKIKAKVRELDNRPKVSYREFTPVNQQWLEVQLKRVPEYQNDPTGGAQ